MYCVYKDMNREDIIAMTEREAYNWIHEYAPDSEEFIRRFNKVHYDCGLSRVGIILEPTRSGELIVEMD